jgi:hypothetical protein
MPRFKITWVDQNEVSVEAEAAREVISSVSWDFE